MDVMVGTPKAVKKLCSLSFLHYSRPAIQAPGWDDRGFMGNFPGGLAKNGPDGDSCSKTDREEGPEVEAIPQLNKRPAWAGNRPPRDGPTCSRKEGHSPWIDRRGLSETTGSAATAPGRGTAGTATARAASHRTQIVENKAGIAIPTIDEVDLDASDIVHGPVIHDDLETVAFQNAVFAFDPVGKGHAEADTAATARGGIDPHTGDPLVHLLHQFGQFAFGGVGKAKILFRQRISQ